MSVEAFQGCSASALDTDIHSIKLLHAHSQPEQEVPMRAPNSTSSAPVQWEC